MPFSNRESDWSFAIYGGFGLPKTGLSEKPSSLPSRMRFAPLLSISSYVSSRWVRICIDIERTPPISLDQLEHGDVFIVQALTRHVVIMGQLDFSISSLESIEPEWMTGNWPRWVECRFPFWYRADRSRVMDDLVSQRLVFQKNRRHFRQEGHSRF
jgi:hypothetical protein